MQFVANDLLFRFIPSFDGNLFAIDETRAGGHRSNQDPRLSVVSISPDELLSSGFRINSDEIVSGGRYSSFYTFDPLSGKES